MIILISSVVMIIGLVVVISASGYDGNDFGKWVGTIMILLAVGGFVWGGITGVRLGKAWRNDIYDYFTLSNDSSEVPDKLYYIKEFRKALIENDVHTGNAWWYNNTRFSNMETQMKILDSLIGRLESIATLDPSSYEYSKALEQLTEHEYKGFNTCIYLQKYSHQSSFRYWNMFGSCQDGDLSLGE